MPSSKPPSHKAAKAPRTKATAQPNAQPSSAPHSPWDKRVCEDLIAQLWALRRSMLESEQRFAKDIATVAPTHLDSARNMVHYLALRATDLRPLQDKLAWLGLSSLGRAESHVLASVDKVLGLLHMLSGQPWQDRSAEEPAGSVSSRHLLEHHTTQLMGEATPHRPVRIMVTLGTEAATDYGHVRELVDAGMDIARINCAHDDPEVWRAMAKLVRRAAKSAKRGVKILMDLGGPKIRTGEVALQPPVLKLKPLRDLHGFTLEPASLHLYAAKTTNTPDADASVRVDAKWLDKLKLGMRIDLTDARGAKRALLVVQRQDGSAVAEAQKTMYISPDTLLCAKGMGGKSVFSTYPQDMQGAPGVLSLATGDTLHLLRTGLGYPAKTTDDMGTPCETPAAIACTLPQVFDQVQVGERVWLDDGRIGGVIRAICHDYLDIDITQTRAGGEKLRADKGINMPDTKLDLPALTDNDLQDLHTVAELADMVGMSFVQKPTDVETLLATLQQLQRADMGIILKIETARGFESLPELMLAAMAAPAAGVMIARGDLAVECGFERMAEVQEEILWCAQAAHMPVVWATQVLEGLAKTGMPSRAEISDAGLGVRAECVMLNKGPYIADAITALDDILRRMAGHQDKKRPLLRALQAWSGNTPSHAA
jgi:pyruvate kinase